MDMMQVKFNRFFEAILNDLRTVLQKRRKPKPVGYSENFGDEIIRHARPLLGEPKGTEQ